LKSGRYVVVSASPFLDALAAELEESSKYFAIVALRAHARTPAALRDHLVVGHFIDGLGTPPDAPCYNAGYTVADVLEGRTDWSADEIDEFRQFLDEPRMNTWLQDQIDEIDRTIRLSPVRGDAIPTNDQTVDELNDSMSKRAVLQSAALDPDAMRRLWNGTPFALDTAEPAITRVAVDQPAKELRCFLESGPNSHRRLPPLTAELRKVILDLARQSDIHSLSCPFNDYDLWYALIEEQIRRSKAKGLKYQDAFCLCAPNSGISGMQAYDAESEGWPFQPPAIGGYVHISWEGVCGGDLFIVPAWRKVAPGHGAQPDSLSKLVFMKCNYALSHRDLGIVDCATRTIVAGRWFLYKSNAPYEDCHPFRREK
jgi:hypothetical protein